MEQVNCLNQFHYNFKPLGRKISPVGLGTVKFGRNQNVKNKSKDGFTLPTASEVSNLLSLSLDLGINFIDTAPAYGASEEVLGQALRGRRDNFFLSSKIGEEFDGEKSHYDFSAKYTRMSIERSLKRLKTDYLESILVHCPRDDYEILSNSPVLEELQKIKDQGLIGSFGASTNSIEGGLFTAEHCDSVMVSYNLNYTAEASVIEKCLELDKAVFIKKALLQGFLNQVEHKKPIYECMSSIFSLSQNISVVLGTLKPEHLKENVKAVIQSLLPI